MWHELVRITEDWVLKEYNKRMLHYLHLVVADHQFLEWMDRQEQRGRSVSNGDLKTHQLLSVKQYTVMLSCISFIYVEGYEFIIILGTESSRTETCWHEEDHTARTEVVSRYAWFGCRPSAWSQTTKGCNTHIQWLVIHFCTSSLSQFEVDWTNSRMVLPDTFWCVYVTRTFSFGILSSVNMKT